MVRLLLTAIFVAVLFSPAVASTLGELRNDIRYHIIDTTTTSRTTRYSDSILNYRINQAAREIARASLPTYTTKLISPTTNQQEYTISTDTAKVDKVVYQINSTTDSYRKLTYGTPQSLDNDKGLMWEQLSAGLPTHYYLRGNTLGLVPKPSGSYCFANGIKVYYYKSFADMVSDSDQPWDGQYNLIDYHYLIMLHVSIQCKDETGLPIDRDMATYNAGIARLQTDINAVRPDNQTIPVVK